MFTDKIIFISPLDWGLGHATRCVPLIRELEKNNKVILGITPLTATILDQEFPHLQKVSVPGYEVSYSKTLPLWLKLFLDWGRIRKVIRAEHQLLDKLITEHKIDVVISDNRFGLYTSKARSVFVTHQLFLKTPFASALAQKINKKYILCFDEVWVPDHEKKEKCLSGELSHGIHFHTKIRYIGPLSRLHKVEAERKFDHLILLSGPQPQQGVLKELLLSRIRSFPNRTFVIVSPEYMTSELKNIEIHLSPSAAELSELICASRNVICRSGYSTLMDLHELGKGNSILIPTPGQTEQEYLAEYQKQFHGVKVCLQKDIDLLAL